MNYAHVSQCQIEHELDGYFATVMLFIRMI